MSVTSESRVPLSIRPLGSNNSFLSQNTPTNVGSILPVRVCSTKKFSADSTGVENDNANIIKHHHSVRKVQTTSVSKRNLRERTRVKGVNDGFGKLNMHVLNMRNKSSKVETIRVAIW